MQSDERPSDGLTGLLPTLIARAFKTWPSKSEMKELRVELRLLALGSQGQCSSSSGLSCSWPGRPSQPLPAFAARVASVLVRMKLHGPPGGSLLFGVARLQKRASRHLAAWQYDRRHCEDVQTAALAAASRCPAADVALSENGAQNGTPSHGRLLACDDFGGCSFRPSCWCFAMLCSLECPWRSFRLLLLRDRLHLCGAGDLRPASERLARETWRELICSF